MSDDDLALEIERALRYLKVEPDDSEDDLRRWMAHARAVLQAALAAYRKDGK